MTKPTIYRSLPTKKLGKTDREQAVLLGLVELYLEQGKPIGSHTLQENGFESLSSATIRNYFAKMEDQGLVKQQHTSGGRIPTDKALRIYINHSIKSGYIKKEQEEMLHKTVFHSSKEIATSLNRMGEALSDVTDCAVFISMPRFDQDFIQTVRFITLDSLTLLSVVITDFGLIRTEAIYLEKTVHPTFLKSLEEYFLWRLNKGEKPLFNNEGELKIAQRIYNEIMVRHVVGYANFSEEDILRTGLSKLLAYPEFNDATSLAGSLSLLENEAGMRSLLRECCKKNEMNVWVGSEMHPFVPSGSECAVIATPYRINQTIAGGIALLGPSRLPYRNLFGLSQWFAQEISKFLTESLYKHHISFRSSQNQPYYPQIEETKK